jgi:hypothetical protein
MTAAEIMAAIRKAYPKAAVVREVSIADSQVEAEMNLWRLMGTRRSYWEKLLAETGAPVAESLPPGWTPHNTPPVRRIDALMRESTGYTAIEIKVTRADFKRDTEEKRRAWRMHTRRFIYVTPAGLVNVSEVPDGCGLWEFDGDRLRVVKKATINKSPTAFPKAVFDTMLYRVSNYERAA